MKYLALSLLLCILYVSCDGSHSHINDYNRDKADSVQKMADKQKNDSLQSIVKFKSFLSAIHEPDLELVNYEAYRFVYEPPFSRIGNIFFVKVNEDQTAELKTKYVVEYAPASYHSKLIYAQDSILDSSIQHLSKKEVQEFKNILAGSYYYRLEPGCPDGIVDGDFLALESKSLYCLCKELTYHHVGIHVPREGSFFNAYLYLYKRSLLVKRELKYAHDI